MDLPVGLPISQEDWEHTPPSVRAVVIMLWQANQALKQQVFELQKQVKELQLEVERLRERTGKNSTNSSKPPSTDGPQQRSYPKRESSGRKRGGQRGHTGRGRKLKPPEEVNHTIVCKPTNCQQCGAVLVGEDARPVRHQVSELPRMQAEVTEYQLHSLTCPACGCENQGEWPAEMPKGSFGERMQALIGYLGGRFGISQRDMEEMLATVFRVEISLGSIPTQEQQVSQALEQPVEAAYAYVQQQPTVNLDETGWHELLKNFWLWVGATPSVTVFRLANTRGAKEAEHLLGENYTGIVGSDRYSAYNWLDPLHRQACWAHLKRDFQAFVDRGGESKTVGRLLLQEIQAFFNLWHRFRSQLLSRLDFQTAMRPIRKAIGCLLHIGTYVKQGETRKTCHNILKIETALWTFVDQEGIEPTNNAAERALRRGVIWRRRSFGTQSESGSRFVERILTAVTTCRQQNRDILDFLTEACRARTMGVTAPSLLPGSLTIISHTN